MSRLSFSCLVILAIIFGKEILVSGANVYWRDYRGSVPSDAVPTGHNLYIAQVILNSGTAPGTFYPDRQIAVTEEGDYGRVEIEDNIKILCTTEPSSLKWEYINVNQLEGEFLDKCVYGGYEVQSPLYIGKAYHQGEWKIGKVFPMSFVRPGLRIWWSNGTSYEMEDFQILTMV